MKDDKTIDSILASAETRMQRTAQGDADFQRKCRLKKRNHPKRHSENRERSFIDRTKADNLAKSKASYSNARKMFLATARAYWQSEGDHP